MCAEGSPDAARQVKRQAKKNASERDIPEAEWGGVRVGNVREREQYGNRNNGRATAEGSGEEHERNAAEENFFSQGRRRQHRHGLGRLYEITAEAPSFPDPGCLSCQYAYQQGKSGCERTCGQAQPEP
jgi:hypothetical protein